MKKYLLSPDKAFYKANLHCHTNISDGCLSPEEVKQQYMDKGYSIIAFTDHDVMIPHHDLTDDRFLALTGYEMEISDVKKRDGGSGKTCHLCFVALSPDTERQVCWHREKYMVKNGVNHRHLVKFDDSLPDYERSYSPECINDMIRKGVDAGFFVTYNHPTWSLENYNDYMAYHGMHAMEISNWSSCAMGYPDYNPRVYDDMLSGGKRLFCISADDNHNKKPADHPCYDSFGGWICINAGKLEYRTVTDAMLRGDFYASRGPKIKELWYEDGKVHIETSPVRSIDCIMQGRRKAFRITSEDGAPITSAEFDVRLELTTSFRLTVTDEQGLTADTNAYFFDEL